MGISAGFFDIDGTLYREGLISEMFKKMIKCEVIAPEKWYNEVKPDYVKWDKRQGDYDNYLIKMAGIYTETVKGLHKSQIEFIARQVIEQKGDRVYTYTRDRIKWHKEEKHKIICISGSPLELVREMALKHGFDDYMGTQYLLDKNDLYTGEVVPMWDSRSKSKAIKYFVDKYDIDLDKSFAYGDTAGDYSMFDLVKNPVCVNPTRELLKKIRDNETIRNKVEIIVERKDVIYKFNGKDIDSIFGKE